MEPRQIVLSDFETSSSERFLKKFSYLDIFRGKITEIQVVYVEVHIGLLIYHPLFQSINRVPVTASLVLMKSSRKILNLFISMDSW